MDEENAVVEALFQILSQDEKDRARRFRFQHDREQFIVARGQLRILLSCYVGRHPCELEVCYGVYGKPALTRASASEPVRFNLSHSGSLALVAVTAGRDVGVDVERVRPGPNLEQIASRFFSAREAATLHALPVRLRTKAFFACWTRKEAFVKARGNGLSQQLDEFDVSLAPGEPARLLRTGWDPKEVTAWSLYELEAGIGYAAALAVRGRVERLRYMDMN